MHMSTGTFVSHGCGRTHEPSTHFTAKTTRDDTHATTRATKTAMAHAPEQSSSLI